MVHAGPCVKKNSKSALVCVQKTVRAGEMGGEMVGVGEISGVERWGNGKMLLPLQKQRIEDVKQLVIRTCRALCMWR